MSTQSTPRAGRRRFTCRRRGESLLIDAGSAGGRDPGRILATAKEAGLTQIDYLIVTHYDGDHVGGATEVSG
jgi:competence protein ComEC